MTTPTSQPTPTLGDMFPVEQARCRALLDAYREIGPVGKFGLLMIEQVLKRADRAAVSGDVVEMIRSYKEMQECS